MQNKINDELPSSDDLIFEEILQYPHKIYNNEILTESDYIKLYEYIMRKFKENENGFDINSPIYEIRDYLETLPEIQEYMCINQEERNNKKDLIIIKEIIDKLEQRKKDKKNPFKQFIRSLKC